MANAPWITITSNDKGTGSQVIYCMVKANSSLSSREGTLTVGDRMLKITQAGLMRYPLHLAKIGTGTGTIASTPAGANFEAGTLVTLNASPSPSSDFAGWSGQCSGTSPTCILTISAGTTVKANFRLKTFVIAASAGANGSITPSGRIVVRYGASQKFIFKPNKGHKIGQIKVDGDPAGNSEVLLFGNIMSSHKISVIFTPLR
jgi:hypothetical protein